MRIVVTGAAGLIGQHFVNRLKADGHFVRGIDLVAPTFAPSRADEFVTLDLRYIREGDFLFENVDEVYQLAADMGGIGFIMDRQNDAAILRNSVQINLNVLEACRYHKVPRVFFSSSACVYRSMQNWVPIDRGFIDPVEQAGCKENSVPPLDVDNEYAVEKFFSERLYASYRHCYGIETFVARLHNVFGPLGEYEGGREKAPAAICRKVAEAKDGGEIEVWGDGSAMRSYMHVSDCVEGIVRQVRAGFPGPLNIGSSEMVSVDQLVREVARIAGKVIAIRHVPGPTGVRGRNSDNALIREKLGWEPSTSLRLGLEDLYPWVENQVLTWAGAA